MIYPDLSYAEALQCTALDTLQLVAKIVMSAQQPYTKMNGTAELGEQYVGLHRER